MEGEGASSSQNWRSAEITPEIPAARGGEIPDCERRGARSNVARTMSLSTANLLIWASFRRRKGAHAAVGDGADRSVIGLQQSFARALTNLIVLGPNYAGMEKFFPKTSRGSL
jgi:hypothetical protein